MVEYAFFTDESGVQVSTNGCRVQAPENGQLILDPLSSSQVTGVTTVPNNGLIQYRCNDGYEIDGSDIAICVDGTHDPDPPTCIGRLSL